MAHITLQVLDGADRGKYYENLPVPVTIGREEGNVIQLNDERISRFHLKIQEDQSRLVLTDLDSTNGTRVNGEQTQLRILRHGDVIALGRSVLRFGSREQIAARLDEIRRSGAVPAEQLEQSPLAKQSDSSLLDREIDWQTCDEAVRQAFHLPAAPELPEGLSPGQAAQLSELLEYLHLHYRALIDAVQIPEGETTVSMNLEHWQDLLDMQAMLAAYLDRIGGP